MKLLEEDSIRDDSISRWLTVCWLNYIHTPVKNVAIIRIYPALMLIGKLKAEVVDAKGALKKGDTEK